MRAINVLRKFLPLAAAIVSVVAAPASAQFFFRSHDMAGAPVTGSEPGILPPMPGATPAELTAGLVWELRSALNVAALQCQFAPTLLTVAHYNAMIQDHDAEFDAAQKALIGYFIRVNKTKSAGQNAFDQFNTRVSSDFSTVSAQYPFCQTASEVGEDVVFAPRGSVAQIARNRMRELRNSLVPWGEQMFPGQVAVNNIALPRLDDACWRKDSWNDKKCGPDPFDQHATAYASR
ncbi:MAG: hypothetical protein ACTHMG_07515 [Sphingomonas sp.]